MGRQDLAVWCKIGDNQRLNDLRRISRCKKACAKRQNGGAIRRRTLRTKDDRAPGLEARADGVKVTLSGGAQ